MHRLPSTVFISLFLATSAHAQNEPIQSPQDAACRDEARDRVFGAPNPQGLSFYNLGAQIYRECMKRSGSSETPSLSRRAPRG
ncbi:hypothetical protein F6X51_19655 [Methylobacterium planeticum]|uniref:Uncharacterized protein n=1 Tax=Methylobacterium planeticum TaxID=2615211 RepID=A0A6N6MLK4_9HYPH|nr:hypothetical protein F6X51_19655 [Methylobacterium planeticum]